MTSESTQPTRSASASVKTPKIVLSGQQSQGAIGKERAIDLVALDIDDTLLKSDKGMSLQTAKTIWRAVDMGVKVVLASARPPRSVYELQTKLKLDTYQINYNGALVYDQALNRTIFHQPLDPMLGQSIIKAARQADPKVVVSVEVMDKWYTDHVDESLPTKTSLLFKPDFIGPLDAFWFLPMTKLLLLAPPDRMMNIRKILAQKYLNLANFTVSDKHLVQIMHKDVDKATALARVAQAYHVPQAKVMAVGDAPNDVGMLEWAGLGVAVENSWKAAIKAADVVVPSNDHDGVGYAIRRYVFGEPVEPFTPKLPD